MTDRPPFGVLRHYRAQGSSATVSVMESHSSFDRPIPAARHHRTAALRGAAAALAHRWPTALALAVGVLSWGGGSTESGVRALGEALLLLPLGYLVVAALGRPRSAWVVLVAGIAVFVGLRAWDVVAPSVVLVAVAFVALAWGALGGRARPPGPLGLQALGMLGFGAIALAGAAMQPDAARWLVAGGWFLHGAWDLVHFWRRSVVVPSYAEWCGVVDVLIAVELALAV